MKNTEAVIEDINEEYCGCNSKDMNVFVMEVSRPAAVDTGTDVDRERARREESWFVREINIRPRLRFNQKHKDLWMIFRRGAFKGLVTTCTWVFV